MNRATCTGYFVLSALGAAAGVAALASAQGGPIGPPSAPAPTGPSSSIMARLVAQPPTAEQGELHMLRSMSLFAIAPPEIRSFSEHDLVQVIVRESSSAESDHELDLKKNWSLTGDISTFPWINELEDIEVEAAFRKLFKGDAAYEREDDFTARLTAEVIEVLPNDNLVLEARTYIRTDEEEQIITVTGICRPEDITAANTILSSQLHDLTVEKINKGELKKSNEKGLFAQILDTIFAF